MGPKVNANNIMNAKAVGAAPQPTLQAAPQAPISDSLQQMNPRLAALIQSAPNFQPMQRIQAQPMQFQSSIAPPPGTPQQGPAITPYARVGQPTTPGGPVQAPPPQEWDAATQQAAQLYQNHPLTAATFHMPSFAAGVAEGRAMSPQANNTGVTFLQGS